MPESVTTDNVNVATILAAAELVKITQANPSSRTPDGLAKAYKTIHKAIHEARVGK